MSIRIAGLTGATLETAPSVCHECVWWQSRTAGRAPVTVWPLASAQMVAAAGMTGT